MENEDYLFGDEEETPETEPESNFKQLRSHANKLEKTLKQREAELEELKAFKMERVQAERTAQVSKVFTDLGLTTPAATKLWNLENPEAEPQPAVVQAWAVENGFAVMDEPPVQDTGFTPTTTPEGTPPGSKRLSRQEWQQLANDDPMAAQKAFQQGRVDLSDVRVGLGLDR